MAIRFEPQFHKRLTPGRSGSVWVALPHPRTLIPVKLHFYREWQLEESVKLQEAGETVLAFAISC
jgi:hypothetical protein